MKLIFNISQLLTVHSKTPKRQSEMNDLGLIENAAIAFDENEILEVGESTTLFKKYSSAEKIDAKFKVVMPGFVDSHTHFIYGGSRHEEYVHKILGQSYSDLHHTGGIKYTVKKTREASLKQLIAQGKTDLELMLLHGTTTVEGKTGYGLDLENEEKILTAMKSLKNDLPIDLKLTFLGAHTVPMEYENKTTEYLELVKNMLLKFKDDCDFMDVWCDPLGFNIQQTQTLCEQAQKLGLKIKLHVEQTGNCEGAELAAKYNAISCDHLDHISPHGMKKLGESTTIGVLLPGVTYHLMEFDKKIPVQKMLEENMALALATDYNPGSCPTLSMQNILENACRLYKMSYAQALNAATINAAFALDCADQVGSLAKGKKADLLILDVDEYGKIIHKFGINHVVDVFKNGVQVVKAQGLV